MEGNPGEIKSLQSALKEKERQLNNEKLRFRKLKEDFEYNLKLLEERDQELQRYDVLFSQVKNINSLRNGEVSDLNPSGWAQTKVITRGEGQRRVAKALPAGLSIFKLKLFT